MRNPNFLILDEPTNDLDILTLNVLEEYIQNFKGCVIIVSHDRYFMDKLADHIFVFEGNGIIKDFPGNYTDYHNYTLQKEKEKKSLGKKDNLKSIKTEKVKKSSLNKLSHKERKEFEQLSKEIEELETEKTTLEQQMNSGNLDHLKLMALSERVGGLIKLLDHKSERWMELSEMNN
jgi:ATP-binding cassette subfamily F protein uup